MYLESVINSVDESSLLINPGGNILSCNDTAAQRIGIIRKKLIGMNLFSIMPRDIATNRKKMFHKVIASKLPINFEDSRKGIEFSISFYPAISPDGNVNAIAIHAKDISLLKQLGQRITLAEKQVRALVEGTSDTVFITDCEGNFKYVSSKVSTLFGLSVKDTFNKKNVNQLIDGINITSEELLRTGGIVRQEYSFTNLKGHPKVFLITITYVDITDISRIYTIHDITEKAALLNELKRKEVALSELVSTLEKEKKIIRSSITDRLDKLVYPIIDIISGRPGCSDIAVLLKSSLSYATSTTSENHSLLPLNLSPRELQLCNMIRNGLTIKQAAQLLDISPLTVERQRKSIRKKLGIADGKTNLTNYLNMIFQK